MTPREAAFYIIDNLNALHGIAAAAGLVAADTIQDAIEDMSKTLPALEDGE